MIVAMVSVAALFGQPISPASAGTPRVVCVLVPHFKDEYWLSVGYGLEQEARQHDVALLFFEAGGYRSRTTQIDQLKDCAMRGVDAILIGAVTSDHADLLSAIRAVSVQVPVFGLVNELGSSDLSGRIGVDWQQMGLVLGRYLAWLHPADAAPQTAVLVSGPAEALEKPVSGTCHQSKTSGVTRTTLTR